MAKEWDKFQAEYKTYEKAIKTYTAAEAAKLKKRVSIALSNAWEGEDFFRESLAKARENGVTSEKLADFQKDKDFKDGLGTWKKAAELHQEEVAAMTAFCDQAGAVHAKMARLLDAITKDLKKRAKSSESKKDIEALRDALTKQVAEIKKAADAIGTLSAAQKLYSANFKRAFDRILKESPDSQSKKKDANDLPQMLVDRNRKKYSNQVAALVKAISALCDSAMGKAATDLKGAVPDLKSAAAKLKDLKKVTDSYQAVKKKFPDAIEESKEKKAILEMIKKFDAAYTAAERKLRGTTVTIKKAAVG